LSGRLQTGTNSQSSGFKSGFITGLSLGVIWTPCAGPILATIATLAATQAVSINVVFVTIAYIIGVGIPLFFFATLGSYFFTRSRFLSKYTGRIQQVFGVIMILAAVAIATNYDKVLQVKLLNTFPAFSNFQTQLEGNKEVKKQLDALKNTSEKSSLPQMGEAPGFDGATKWLNTDKPLTKDDLKGKVVLVDFWTYTCINCIRTLPHVTRWYDKYKDQGFVVIGVHSPEFAFEKNTDNVLAAIKQYNIHYPVPQDNDFTIWKGFNNQYWPAEYLIDAKGVVRRTHFGEGEYDEMEKAIQDLLKEAGKNVNTSLDEMPDQAPTMRFSPETYLGSARMEYYHPNGSLPNGTKSFSLLETPSDNTFSLGGEWTIRDENAVTGKGATLVYNFYSDKVFLVLRPPTGKTAKVKVLLDGKVVGSDAAGKDVKDGVVLIDSDRLYELINLKGKPASHFLKLEFQTPGTETFAFTFG
jgi:thiol-disulfide isomerase/thioredoxin